MDIDSGIGKYNNSSTNGWIIAIKLSIRINACLLCVMVVGLQAQVLPPAGAPRVFIQDWVGSCFQCNHRILNSDDETSPSFCALHAAQGFLAQVAFAEDPVKSLWSETWKHIQTWKQADQPPQQPNLTTSHSTSSSRSFYICYLPTIIRVIFLPGSWMIGKGPCGTAISPASCSKYLAPSL